MGAIRAFEMRRMGMIGYGEVYRAFCDSEDFTDDEVAQLHGPAPEYVPVSEPLVNIRHSLATASTSGLISEGATTEILDCLKKMYFGDRTLAKFSMLVSQYVGRRLAAVLVRRLTTQRVKTSDFVRLMSYLQRDRVRGEP